MPSLRNIADDAVRLSEDRIAALQQRNAELEAALRPFADAYRAGGDFYSIADRIDGTHFARAAALVPKQEQPAPPFRP